MKKGSKILSIIAGIFLLVSILLTIVDVCCFDHSYYESEYAKSNSSEVTGMSNEDLTKATDTLLDYLQDKRDDIVVEAEVNGYIREVFNERETLHMVDVKNLYQNALKVRNMMFIGAVLLLIVIYCRDKKHFYDAIKFGFQYSSMMIMMFVGFIVIWAIADFDNFWIQFHYLFFDNTLFFLDPNTSIMINMFPDTFFFDLVVKIILWYAGILAVMFAGIKIYGKKVLHA